MKKKLLEIRALTRCNNTEEKITLAELAGLWIILGCTFVISLICWAIKKYFGIKFTYMSPYYDYYTEKTQLFEE